MSPDELRKLRQYFHSLRGIVPIIAEARGNVDHYPVRSIEEEIGQLLAEFPRIVPEFNPQEFYMHESGRTRYFDSGGVRSYLSRVLGRLQIIIEESIETPVTQRKEFTFIRNPDLRRIVERDFAEAQRAFISDCWKSTIVLAGGIIEAILSDQLLANQGLLSSAAKAPKTRISRAGISPILSTLPLN